MPIFSAACSAFAFRNPAMCNLLLDVALATLKNGYVVAFAARLRTGLRVSFATGPPVSLDAAPDAAEEVHEYLTVIVLLAPMNISLGNPSRAHLKGFPCRWAASTSAG